MSLYRKLSQKPKLFLSVTGMNLHQFQTLLPQFTHASDKSEQRRKRKVVRTGKKRLRQIGGGAQFANSLPDRVLMLLCYYRLYLTQEFMTLLFKSKDKSVICRSIQLIRPVFEAVLPVPEQARSRVLSLAAKEQKRRGKRIGSYDTPQNSDRYLRCKIAAVPAGGNNGQAAENLLGRTESKDRAGGDQGTTHGQRNCHPL